MITVRVDTAMSRVYFQNLLAQARRPVAILMVAGRAVANLLKRWYRQRDRDEPNKLGGPRTHYWLEVAGSVQAPVVEGDSAVSVTISHPTIAQKIFGGTIRAKRVRNLSIPETPEAYGRTPATYERETGLRLVFLKQGDNAILASRADGQGLTVQYLLTPSVRQKPDPRALPPEEQMRAEAIAAADKALERQLQQPNHPPI